jgi:glycosyltransferase involved in cell wall biosynthesis
MASLAAAGGWRLARLVRDDGHQYVGVLEKRCAVRAVCALKLPAPAPDTTARMADHTETRAPRVTLAIATYNGERYLAEAIESCLAQDYDDYELLIVDDCSTDGTRDVIARYAGHPRVRVVLHPENRGIAGAYNTIWREARGELIARLGHDDVCQPDRLRRQVEIFDRHPDTGVVHGEGVIIDAAGRPVGRWGSADFPRRELIDLLVRRHNLLLDPSTMVHRRVYGELGGYREAFPMCNDFDLWLRAAPRFRFRHCAGGPLIRYRRHGENFSDESARARETDEVTRALAEAIAGWDLRDLVPELDWAVLDPAEAERRALLVLADAVERRELPLPALAAQLRERAAAVPAPARSRARHGRRIMLTSFGFNDSGGGTIVPRYVSKELVRRGWDVTVFHAAVGRVEPPHPYQIREWEEDGVRLIGVHNRPHGLLDLGNPAREVDDPPITAAFADALDRVEPDVIHFHNLHNLGSGLLDAAAARGIPAYFSTHNYWLACPRNYLFTESLGLCHGPGDRGGDCAPCVGSSDREGYRRRLSEIRARFSRGVTTCLAVSEAMKRTLVSAGYPEEMIDVVVQGMPEAEETWRAGGRDRRPGRVGGPLRIGFFGSAYPHKGPELLVHAVQELDADIEVRIHGEVPPAFADRMRAHDRRGVVEICGGFGHGDLPRLLADVDVAVIPSLWWDCAPLMVAECLAGGVPVVGARMGGITDFVTDGENGLLFEGRSVAGLRAALERLANEPGLLERLQAGIRPPRPFAEYVDELEAYYAGERPARDQGRTAPVAVRWVGDHGKPTSLSIVNTRVCEFLASAPGLAVERVTREGESLDPPPPHPAEVEVRHQWPPDLRPSTGRLAVVQPWEFGAVPRDWVAEITRNVDELWVPSEYVRRMYLDAGIPADRLHVVPNGVDLDRFTPDGPALPDVPADGVRFLFVGGVVGRKGPDVLVDAYRRAFAGRDDVTLVIKDFGADGIYKGIDRDRLRRYAADGALPRIVYLDRELTDDEMAALYRSCDVLVHPYRGEGFAMPVLEAMASGLPAIATAGGPTDEFCPPDAGWRIRSERRHLPDERVDHLVTAGRPWMLEPDGAHLAELLLVAAANAGERERRGRAARVSAERLPWTAVADRYRARIEALAARPPLHAAPAAPDAVLPAGPRRLLATPAWRGDDRLADLLGAWAATSAGDPACLLLLADPRVDGRPEELEARVLGAAAAAGVDLDRVADIELSVQPLAAADLPRLHAAVDGYAPVHDACAGHVRLAERAGRAVVAPTAAAVAAWLGAAGRRAAA